MFSQSILVEDWIVDDLFIRNAELTYVIFDGFDVERTEFITIWLPLYSAILRHRSGAYDPRLFLFSLELLDLFVELSQASEDHLDLSLLQHVISQFNQLVNSLVLLP